MNAPHHTLLTRAHTRISLNYTKHKLKDIHYNIVYIIESQTIAQIHLLKTSALGDR